MRTYKVTSSPEIEGLFWQPSSPDKKFSARFTLQEGSFRLLQSPVTISTTSEDADGPLQRLQRIGTPSQANEIEAIHGHTSEGKCTLFYLSELTDKGFNEYSLGVHTTAPAWHVSSALLGLHLSHPEAATIEAGRYYISRIHQLLPNPLEIVANGNRTSSVVTHGAFGGF